MMNKIKLLLILVCVITCFQPVSASQQAVPDTHWFERDQQGNPVIQLYFFWSEKCGHCLQAQPFVKDMAEESDDIKLHAFQLIGEQENILRYQKMANVLGQAANSVPAFFFCNTMRVGYDSEKSPLQLRDEIDQCRQHINKYGSVESFQVETTQQLQIKIPFIGAINPNDLDSLPLITLLLASIDAFNPCAFFVLMFLLSMMLHTHSRARMLMIGGVFVFMSGLMYFLFMAAWLNLFQAIGQLNLITVIAGVVALTIGLINVKDFFWFKRGVSLSISDSSKLSLFKRMRNLLNTRSTTGVLLATIGLALFANLYEFLCTAGFPMVYTRLLTLTGMPDWKYYLYLLFYNLIYIVPLLVIVIVFAWSLGARKLQQREGRQLKLISGVMMSSLGLILLLAPEMLQNIVVTAVVLIMVILFSVLVIAVDKRLSKS